MDRPLFRVAPTALTTTSCYEPSSGWRLRVSAGYRLADGEQLWAHDDYAGLTTDELGSVVSAALEEPPWPIEWS